MGNISLELKNYGNMNHKNYLVSIIYLATCYVEKYFIELFYKLSNINIFYKANLFKSFYKTEIFLIFLLIEK